MASRNNRKKKNRQQKKKAENAEEDILKAQADDALKAQKYDKALQLYNQAIEFLTTKPADEDDEDDAEGVAQAQQARNEKLSALYANRSQTQYQLKTFLEAVKDADKSIELFPKKTRAYFRKGQALEATLAYEDAVKVYKQGLDVEPGNAQLMQALTDLQTILDDIEATQKRIAAQVNPDQDKYEKMVQWLLRGGSKFPKLYLEYYSEDYRGVHALTKIPPDEVILEVPLDMIMTSDIAKEAHFGKLIVDSGMELLSSHTYLATYLLQEKHKGGDSKWKPFIDILPVTYRNMPIFFDDEEKAYMQGSFSVRKMNERIESLKTEYGNLCDKFPDFKQFTYEEFVWARMVVITRIFGFYIKGRKTDGLVAMADMLNHKFPQDKDVKWAFDDDRNGFIMTSIKTIQPGQQVFDSYGRKCNHRFFVNYGFSLEENEDNEVILRVQVKRDDPLVGMKSRLLQSGGHGLIKEFQIPANTKHEKSKELLAFCRISNASGTELMVVPVGEELKVRFLV
eukprot:TRINITY_DN1528_c0_g1_i4.p2 TRINITY_DN1528_c0_g1~~TRINITY_DN1528_c0_g1_i4.p2  ORF type:complete len:510 (+),score=157.82 TRINITY_DN1528_c0_g1_i4:2578-4107(+)